MAKNNESTMKWKVDIGQLTKAMQEAKRSISIANAEFKTATAGMDRWSKSTTGLEAKIKQLNSTLPQQRKILGDLEKQYKITADNMGENSKEAVELKIKIEEQRATIVKTETNIRKYNDQLDQMQKEQAASETAYGKLNKTIKDQQDALDDLKTAYSNAVVQYGKNSKEAISLASDIDRLSGELADNKAKMNDAEKSADKLDKSLDDVGDSADGAAKGGFTVLKGALANLVADGFRKAIDGAKEFATTMIGEAANVRAEASQFEQTFGDMGDEAEAAIKRVADSTGILDTRLKVVGSQIYAFARSSGASVPEAMELMETALMASADSAAYYDKSLADSAETLQSFLKGNYANDAALGVSATEFTRNAKATELFGKKYNDLTEIQKQQTLLKMVTDSQKLSGAMGQASREADGWENVQGNLNEAWRQFKANVGTPFLEALIPVIQSVTTKFQEWQTNVDWDAFNKTVKDVANNIMTGFKWVIDNGDAIMAVIAGIVSGFMAFKTFTFIAGLVSTLKTLFLVIKAGVPIMKALNIVMGLNPIGLIIGAIAGLVAAFVVLWNKSEAFRNFWIGLWEKIKEITSTVVQAIADWFSGLWDWIQNIWINAGEFFAGVWEGIKAVFAPVIEFFSTLFGNAWIAIQNIWLIATVFFQTVWDGIVAVFSPVIEWFRNIFQSAWDGIVNIWNTVKGFFQGVWNGIKNVFSPVINWFRDTFEKAWKAIKGVFSAVGEFFGGIWETIKEKFSDIGQKVGTAIGDTFKTAVNAVLATAENVLNAPIRAINSLIGKLQGIPGLGGLGTLSEFSLPRLAQGGVLAKGQVGLLEGSGAEAVVPLEKNKKWIARVVKEMVEQLDVNGVKSIVNGNINAMNGNVPSGGYVTTQNVTFNQYNTSPQALDRLSIYRETNNLLFSAKVRLQNV